MNINVAKIVKIVAVIANAVAGVAIAWATSKQNEQTLETLVDSHFDNMNN